MKIIVRSTSPKHGLLNSDGKFLPPLRPVVALMTTILQNRIAKGDFRLLVGNLDDSATDVEFLKYIEETKGDDADKAEKLSIDSFESTYSMEALRRKGVEEDLTPEQKQALADAKKAEKDRDDAAQSAALLTAAGNAVVEPGLAEAAAGSQDSTTTQTANQTPDATPAKGTQNTPTPASNKR